MDLTPFVPEGTRPAAVLVSPKTFELCVLSVSAEEYFFLSVVGGERRVARSYLGGEGPGPASSYQRIHSPSSTPWELRGRGYGLLLYSGTAVAVDQTYDEVGVYSEPGGRTDEAEALWKKLVDNGLAEREGDEEHMETEEHCESIGDREKGNGVILDDEICGDVTVEYPGDQYDLLAAAAVRKEVFYLGDAEHFVDAAPADLLMRVRVGSKEAAILFAEQLREQGAYEVATAYMQLPHVLELFGQRRLLGVGRLGGAFGAGGRGVGRAGAEAKLPPLSARTAAMISRWRDVD